MKTPCEPNYFAFQSREFERDWNRKRNYFRIVIGKLVLAVVATIAAGVMGL